jgi:regulator of sirC expression with transglutaminase-like and TPR domain
MPAPTLAEDLLRALEAPGDDLAPAALLLPRLERRRVDAAPYLRRLDELGTQAAARLDGVEATRERVDALNTFLFRTLDFSGTDAVFVDPRTHFLGDVLDRRVGIPIALCAIYIEVGRRAGLPVEGVSFPGHFLVRCRDHQTDELLVIDAFNGGALLSERDCYALLKEHAGAEARWNAALLAAATRRQIVTRMITNLKRAYVSLRAFPQARRASDLLFALDPSSTTELRDRGLLAYHLEDFPSALRDLERYLQSIPHASEEPAPQSKPDDQRSALEEARSAVGGDAEEEADETRQEFQQIWEHVKNLRRRVAGFN